jgi:NAD(P)-dependent dehydrogenase (short-subunit alcohol dehydrogenase family)
MLETVRSAEWIYETLHNDATLMALVTGVYRGLAPANTVAPWIVFSHQSGRDVMVNSAYRVMVNELWLVKVVAPSTSMATLVSAADRIDVLLHNSKGALTDATVMEMAREMPVAVDELVNGVLYTNLGGTYRVWVRQGVG